MKPALAATYKGQPPVHSGHQLTSPSNLHSNLPLEDGQLSNMVNSHFHKDQVNIVPVYDGQLCMRIQSLNLLFPKDRLRGREI